MQKIQKIRTSMVTLRKMLLGDCYEAATFIHACSFIGSVLSVSPKQLMQCYRRYWVGICNRKVVATIGYRTYQGGLAEIRSLVVSPEFQGNGIGHELINLAVDEIRVLKYKSVLVLTVTPRMFGTRGFEPVDIHCFHQKLTADCRFCPHGWAGPDDPRCNEKALLLRW